MRPTSLAVVFSLLVLAPIPAQFIHDLRPIAPQRPIETRLLPIVLDSHKVEVGVVDGVAKTKVSLVFRNPNGLQLEGTFMFPMPEGAAMSAFAMLMGGKMVQGEVLEKDRAAAIYQGIVQRQRDPALLEYIGRQLFQAKVFPIPPSGTTEVSLTYDEPLRRDGRTLEYRYPFRTRGVTGSAVGLASFRMSLSSKDSVLTIYSPSHEVDIVKKGDHEATISYERARDQADRDLVVDFGLSKDALGVTLFTHAETDDRGAFLLLLAPSVEKDASIAMPKDVVFVIDTSGSMAGDKIEQTKKALNYCIHALKDGDRFNIVPFATEAQPIFEGLVPADGPNRQRALGYVRETMTARGGTNINDALVQALSMSHDKDRPFLVIFMTDGEPTIGTTTTGGILANVKQANQGLTRLFVFGVGDELKVDLLDLLAEQNHGARDYVGTKENIETRISSFFDKVSSPVLSDVQVEIEKVRATDIYPRPMPDLFRGSQLLVTGRFEGTGPALVRLRGKAQGKSIEHVFEVLFRKGGESSAFVPRLWAVRKAGWLLDQIRLNGENKELKDEVVRLGKTYGIVTPYTSYLVVEDVVAQGPRPPRGFDLGPAGGGSPVPPGGGSAPVRPGSRSAGGGSFGSTTSLPRAAPPLAEGPAPEPSVQTIELLKKLGEEGAPADRKGRTLEAGSARNPQESPPKGEAEKADLGLDLAYRRRLADADESKKADDEIRRGYLGDPIAVSKAIQALRETKAGQDGIGSSLLRHVGTRTFCQKSGIAVESAILDMDAETITKKLVRIEAFSKEYFDLLGAKPALAKVLALGDVLFVDGDRIVQIVPAKLEAPVK